MPLYEYECTTCHRRIEKIQKYSDAELTVCPHCGGRLERTITAAAFSFQGGGWYKDLYSSAKPAASGSSEGTSSSDTSSSSADSGTAPAAGSKPAADSKPAPASAPSAPAASSAAPTAAKP